MVVEIDGINLSLEDIIKVARHGEVVKLSNAAIKKIHQSRKILESSVDKSKLIYGVNTGFGKLVEKCIPHDEIRQLQENLILSHSAGVGKPLDQEVVRAMMLLRANSLAKGYSGVRCEIVQTLTEMLNKKVHPLIPEKGSVGASGDLAPLAHMAAVMMGKGKAFFKGALLSGDAAMKQAEIEIVRFKAKEGIALINGTQVMSALVALAVADSKRLLKIADLVGALTTYVLNGNISQFDEELQKVRPHIGQALTAENMRKLMGEGVPSSRNIQDAYSLRCIPQVHGAIRTAVEHARQVLEIEVNSATDNPLVFPETGKILSGGNFHGEPIALIADYLKIALAELGNISERRINRLLHPDLNGDLPPFLAQNPGLSSGYMLAHYTAAGLASENKVLAHPSSVDSIPLSGDQEDHVSMGTNAARHLREVVKNTGYILAIELLCACQAREFISRPMPKALAVAYQTVREEVPALKKDKDEEVYEHIEMASKIVWGDTLLGAVEEVIGSLN